MAITAANTRNNELPPPAVSGSTASEGALGGSGRAGRWAAGEGPEDFAGGGATDLAGCGAEVGGFTAAGGAFGVCGLGADLPGMEGAFSADAGVGLGEAAAGRPMRGAAATGSAAGCLDRPIPGGSGAKITSSVAGLPGWMGLI